MRRGRPFVVARAALGRPPRTRPRSDRHEHRARHRSGRALRAGLVRGLDRVGTHGSPRCAGPGAGRARAQPRRLRPALPAVAPLGRAAEPFVQAGALRPSRVRGVRRDGRVPDLDSLLEELEAVIDANGGPRVALLGVSGAAPAASAYAVRHPGRVTRLVLLGGYPSGALTRRMTDQERAYLEAQSRLVEAGRTRDDPAVRECFSSRLLPDAPPEVHAGMNEQRRRSGDGAGAAASLRGCASPDVRPFAPSLAVPTLAMRCEGDRACPASLGSASTGARRAVARCRDLGLGRRATRSGVGRCVDRTRQRCAMRMGSPARPIAPNRRAHPTARCSRAGFTRPRPIRASEARRAGCRWLGRG